MYPASKDELCCGSGKLPFPKMLEFTARQGSASAQREDAASIGRPKRLRDRQLPKNLAGTPGNRVDCRHRQRPSGSGASRFAICQVLQRRPEARQCSRWADRCENAPASEAADHRYSASRPSRGRFRRAAAALRARRRQDVSAFRRQAVSGRFAGFDPAKSCMPTPCRVDCRQRASPDRSPAGSTRHLAEPLAQRPKEQILHRQGRAPHKICGRPAGMK